MNTENSREINGFVFQNPKLLDAKSIWKIAKRSKTLDLNSPYHYLIMCRHFRKTCIVALKQGQVVGFVTGFIPPDALDTIFVWQVAVDQKEQGQGLGVQMLINLFNQLKTCNVKHIDATITPSNQPSIRLFTASARALNAPFNFEKEFFRSEDFGENTHEPEMLFHIGPISDKS